MTKVQAILFYLKFAKGPFSYCNIRITNRITMLNVLKDDNGDYTPIEMKVEKYMERILKMEIKEREAL